jgi:prepilin-type N-terminal cleavage/methylation domain-containing protein
MSHTPAAHRQGWTLLEVLTVLLLFGILAALAWPRLNTQMMLLRSRSSLDRVVAELYRARMLAVESGTGAQVILHSDGGACVRSIRIRQQDRDEIARPIAMGPGVCLRHTGDSIISYNSRGMLRPPTRTLHVTAGPVADSVLLSIAGRIRRTYRRRRGNHC